MAFHDTTGATDSMQVAGTTFPSFRHRFIASSEADLAQAIRAALHTSRNINIPVCPHCRPTGVALPVCLAPLHARSYQPCLSKIIETPKRPLDVSLCTYIHGDQNSFCSPRRSWRMPPHHWHTVIIGVFAQSSGCLSRGNIPKTGSVPMLKALFSEKPRPSLPKDVIVDVGNLPVG